MRTRSNAGPPRRSSGWGPAILCGVGAWLLPGAAADGQVATHVVVISYRVTNVGAVPIESTLVTCHLPGSNRYQEILDVQVDPPATATRPANPASSTSRPADGPSRTEPTTALIDLGELGLGRTKVVHVLCWVRPRAVEVSTIRVAGGAPRLSEDERRRYLASVEPFAYETIRDQVRRIVGATESPIEKARAIFNHVASEFAYDIDEHVEPASVVVPRKRGSCSELAFAVVAMCRAAGVPARVVTAFRNREDQVPSTDWLIHRWAEFFVDDLGWVPLDPTRQITQASSTRGRSYWGRQDAEYIAFPDEGLEDRFDPRWAVMLAFHKPADAGVETNLSASWRVSRAMAGEREFFETACRAMAQESGRERAAALALWERQRATLRVPFALDALFDTDPEVRVTAAKVLGGADDATVTLPMIRMADREKNPDVKNALLAGICSLLANRNERLKLIALEDLLKSGSASAAPIAAAMVKDPSVAVRRHLAVFLYRAGATREVEEAYRTLSQDEDDYTCFLAIKQWARLGSSEAARQLVGYLGSQIEGRRLKALAELRQLAGTDFGFNPRTSPQTRANRAARAEWDRWAREQSAK